MSSLRVGLLLPLVFAFAGCSNEPAAVTTGPATAAAAAARSRTPTPMSLSIVSVSPETFSVTGGRAAWQVLEVAYTILDPSKVQSAKVEVYAREIGVISRMDVPVQASGTVRFLVDPQGPSDFGPSVRFRASCPEGATQWYEMGQEPLPADTGDTLRVSNVNPSSIKEGPDESEDSNQRGVGTRVSVYGKKLNAACSLDAQVDGSPVQLNNPLFVNGHFEGLLMRRDIGYRSVSPRYVELKFSIRGPGIGQVAIKNMKIGQ